jgi:hypothetical protein
MGYYSNQIMPYSNKFCQALYTSDVPYQNKAVIDPVMKREYNYAIKKRVGKGVCQRSYLQ